MSLRNIYNRKEFVKIYEFGASEKGGFANNAELQETLLGQVLNGMFKSISWLWRKSKENFVINRLIARLTNELLRGVVTYCFANGINIGTGVVTAASGTTQAQVQVQDSGTTQQTVQELIDEIPDIAEVEEIKALGPAKVPLALGMGNTALAVINKMDSTTELDTIKANMSTAMAQKNPDEAIKQVVILFLSIPEESRKYYIDQMDDKQREIFLAALPESERKKYEKPQAQWAQAQVVEDKPEVTPALAEHQEEEFKSIRDSIKNDDNYKNLDIDNPSPELTHKVFGFKFDINKIVDVKNKEQYEGIVNNMKDYLNTHVKNFDKMTPLQQSKIKGVYLNYLLSNKILKKIKEKEVQKVGESKRALNEEFEHAPMSEPRAGSDPTGKELSTDVKVSDILTKVDKEKYADHKEELGLNLRQINLAAIEKEIEKRHTQKEVSKYVNHENLKTIQLTADQLFLPNRTSLYKSPTVEDKTVEKEHLKAAWKKELGKTYASFVNVLAVSDVDIRDESFKGGATDKRDPNKVKKEVDKIESMTTSLAISDALIAKKVIDGNNKIRLVDLKGRYAYFNFDYKGSNYISTIVHVPFPNINKIEAYIFRIVNTITGLDSQDSVESNLIDFKGKLSYSNSYNVYFLFANPKNNSTNSVVVLNENPVNKKLYLCKFNNNKIDIVEIDDNTDLSNAKISIKANSCNVFNSPLESEEKDEDWKREFGFIDNDKEISYQYRLPESFKGKENYILSIKNKLVK